MIFHEMKNLTDFHKKMAQKKFFYIHRIFQACPFCLNQIISCQKLSNSTLWYTQQQLVSIGRGVQMVCKKNPHKCISNFGALFFSSELFDCFPCNKHFHNFFFQTTKIKGYSFRRQVSRRNRHLVVGGAKIAKVGVALFIDQRPHP